MRILCCGEKPALSSPLLWTAKGLESLGCETRFNYPANISLGRWLRRVLWADVLVSVSCAPANRWSMRRVALAAAMGRPMIRWWAGTDVLNVIRNPAAAEAARQMDRFVLHNVAIAPHLGDELAEVGIQAQVILRSPPEVPPGPRHWSPQLARSVLVYLPAERADFYGARVVEQLVARRGDVTFYILRDDGKRFAAFPNVVSMPWTDDMDGVYAKVGCLLRVTEHDGLARMVLESLARGKHVIYAWPLEGCLLARNADEAAQALRAVEAAGGPNVAGPGAVTNICGDSGAWGRAVMAVLRDARAQRWRWALRASRRLIGLLRAAGPAGAAEARSGVETGLKGGGAPAPPPKPGVSRGGAGAPPRSRMGCEPTSG